MCDWVGLTVTSGRFLSPALHHDHRLRRQGSGFRTCSSTNSDHGAWVGPTIMDTELSVCGSMIGACSLRSCRSVGRASPNRQQAPAKGRASLRLHGRPRPECGNRSRPESSWRHIASQRSPECFGIMRKSSGIRLPLAILVPSHRRPVENQAGRPSRDPDPSPPRSRPA